MTLEEVISTIEIAVAEVEWNYPLNYAIALEEAISALKEKQERGRNNMEWISVKDRLPELDQAVLIYAKYRHDEHEDGTVAISERYEANLGLRNIKGIETWLDPWQYFKLDYEITHWQPLPEPPGKWE